MVAHLILTQEILVRFQNLLIFVPFASGKHVVCKTIKIGPTPIRYSIFPRRTMVVQIPVKDKVVGSNPTVGAYIQAWRNGSAQRSSKPLVESSNLSVCTCN